MNDYLKYRGYADQEQLELLDLVERLGSQKAVAEHLGINQSNITRRLQVLENKALRSGYNPEHGIIDRSIYATSTLVKGGEDDNFALRWTKAKTTTEKQIEHLINVIDSKEYKPAPVVKSPKAKANSDLLTLYTITDFHLAMYAWKEETGDDWDTDIAETVMMNAIDDMISGSPDSEIGLLNIQGDFLHWDGLDAVTPTNRHVLDADTRFDRMIELSMDLCVWSIERLLNKHKKVHVIICEGNHDLAGSAWLRKHIKKMMAKNKRVTVDDTPFPYYAYQHGVIGLGFHHGHKKKNASLPSLFASEPRFRGMWGECQIFYIHSGHLHHAEQDVKEDSGAIVERHPTLAARDAHAARGGWVSYRAAKAITYHLESGEVHRVTVTPRQ
jgi:hypothetical protein